MGCGCSSKSPTTITTTSGGGTITAAVTGYKATFEDGTSKTYLTDLEAKRAVRKAGGGTVSYVTG